MILAGAILMLAQALAPSAEICSRRPCDVATVRSHRLAWDGKMILVRGVIEGCHGGLRCTLRMPASKPTPTTPWITLDMVKEVEPSLGRADGAEVVLRGRVTAVCAGDEICVDRGPDLVPINIVRVLSRPTKPMRKN